MDISSQLASTLKEIKVHEGDRVSDNQELITLAAEDLRNSAQLANKNYERNLKLFQAGTISQDTMDQIKSKKDDTDIRLAWSSIRSPIQGTVLNLYHQPGEWVSPGVKLLTLSNIKDISATIYVPQPEVSKLKVGEILVGRLPELNNRKFEGKIVKINDEAEFTPKNVQTRAERTRLVFGVKVGFLGQNDEEILKPGMTIEIDLPKQ